MSKLLLQCGSNYVTKSELKKVRTPKGTESWKPVPHIRVANLIKNEATNRGYEIEKEEYGLNASGTKMFGVLRMHPNGHPEYSKCIGIRNSHDKSFSLGITAGLRVLVCDNLSFSGSEMTIMRRHTQGIDIKALIPQAFDNLQHHFIKIEKRVDELKIQKISIDTATLTIVQAAQQGAIRPADILNVKKEFEHPRHTEFKEHNRWNLYNCFTEISKKYSPLKADTCYKKLANIFKI